MLWETWSVFATVALVAIPPARCAETPRPGGPDHRIRSVAYSDQQVYTLTGFYGYAVTLVFDHTEAVAEVVLGDPLGWEVKPVRNLLTIKPKAVQPDTSMVVVTSRRTYVFDVRTKTPRSGGQGQALDRDQAFLIRFDYPEELRQRLEQQANDDTREAERRRAEQTTLEMERRAVAALPSRPINRRYAFSGARELAPTEAWDDGRFTFLRFNAEQGVPAIYTISAEGSEVIAPKHFERDVLVVQRNARKLVLRRGQLVTCVWNEGPQHSTEHGATGASDPAAARLLRRAR